MVNFIENNRSILWLGGFAVLVFGLLAALLILPAISGTAGTGGPDIELPKMQNVPPEQVPNMRLDLEKER